MKMTIGERSFPAKWRVCPRCEGNGVHVNPSIDAGGITEAEMHELGDDFREEYMGGTYDVRCYTCEGKRVVKEVRWWCLNNEDQEYIRDTYEQEAYDRAEAEAERRMGC